MIFGNSIRLVSADCIVSVCQAKRKMRQEQMRYIENIKLIDSTTNLNSFEFNVRFIRFVNALYVFCFLDRTMVRGPFRQLVKQFHRVGQHKMREDKNQNLKILCDFLTG